MKKKYIKIYKKKIGPACASHLIQSLFQLGLDVIQVAELILLREEFLVGLVGRLHNVLLFPVQLGQHFILVHNLVVQSTEDLVQLIPLVLRLVHLSLHVLEEQLLHYNSGFTICWSAPKKQKNILNDNVLGYWGQQNRDL